MNFTSATLILPTRRAAILCLPSEFHVRSSIQNHLDINNAGAPKIGLIAKEAKYEVEVYLKSHNIDMFLQEYDI